jgi:hypothetical protein
MQTELSWLIWETDLRYPLQDVAIVVLDMSFCDGVQFRQRRTMTVACGAVHCGNRWEGYVLLSSHPHISAAELNDLKWIYTNCRNKPSLRSVTPVPFDNNRSIGTPNTPHNLIRMSHVQSADIVNQFVLENRPKLIRPLASDSKNANRKQIAWFQASAAKYMRTAFFWVIT